MDCASCGHQNGERAKFCEECGAALVRRCAKCAVTFSASAKFCPECGEPASATALHAPTRFATPDAYTPRHLAEQILLSRTALEGERKQVTVLFADLKGSLELLAAGDPEEARKLLDPVLERMMEAVHFYEGTVNQVMGDGIMALFGAPIAHEDHALRACYAALRMQSAIKKHAGTQAVSLQIRVGLTSGDVVVRTVGSDLRMDYSAVGQTTHIAARMEQSAPPGSILMSEATMRFVEEWVRASPLGPVPVKGLAAPLEVFELVGANPVRSRLQAQAGRGLTKFVGRHDEIEQLVAALRQVCLGQGKVVAVTADAGMGKSRLCSEFVRSTHAQDCLVLEAGCASYRKTTAYLPVIELLRGYFQIGEGDDEHKIREKVSGKVLSLDVSLESYLAPLQWLLDVTPDDVQWQELDARQRRQRTGEGLRRLLLREAQVQPVIVLFEDLHWLDAETQALLDSLVEQLPTARLLLLVNYRPEYRHDWSDKACYRQIRIEPLAASTAEELLEALLGNDPPLGALKRRLIDRTEGNPFFLEETVRSLCTTGVLVGETGKRRLTQAIETVEVAPTVQAILAARIDQLPDDPKRLLQCAAVIGTEVPFNVLEGIADQSNEDLRGGLHQLRAGEFVFESRLFPDIEYSFRHALTHDVAYSSLLQDRRRALHGRIVATIEHLHSERLAEHVERLAHHAFRGEVWDKAVDYCRQAGVKAQERSAHREAVSWFEQALAALRRLPESKPMLIQAIDVRLSLRGSLYPVGEFEKILLQLREAEAIALRLDDPARLGWVSLHIGDILRQMGQLATASTFSERAGDIADKLQDLRLKVVASQFRGQTLHALGKYREAAELIRFAVETPFAGGGEWRTQAGSQAGFVAVNLAWLARCLAEVGSFDEAIAYGRQGLTLAESLNTPYSIAATAFALGFVYGMRGDLDQAIALVERSRAMAHDWQITLYECHALRALGYAYLRRGRVDDAIVLLQEGAATVEARALAVQRSRLLAVLAEACLAADRPDEARTAASRALAVARENGQRGDEAAALAALGHIAMAGAGEHEAAWHHYTDAAALATELGMRPLLARCQVALGRIHLAAGRHSPADEQLAAAVTLCCAMKLPWLLRQAVNALGRPAPTLVVSRERSDLHGYLGEALQEPGIRVVLEDPDPATAGAPPFRIEREMPPSPPAN